MPQDAPRPSGAGVLSLVGTPIGNLGDLSGRVRDTLAAADVVLCEDTRVTGRLLSAMGLRRPLERCDENVIASRVPAVLERLESGQRVAFASDAGMPAVSDPGRRLVDAALDAGLPVEVVPGPSAVTCAVAASGLDCSHFFFEGFLPRKAGARRERLDLLARVPGAVVLYESPHRVAATLAAVAEAMPGRRVALVRELTKLHEECQRGPAAELAAAVVEAEAQGRPVRGECVVVVESPGVGAPAPGDGAAPDPEALARELLGQGTSPSAAAKEVARRCGLARPAAYDIVVSLKG